MNEELNEQKEQQEQQEDSEQLEIYSQSVRAGKRTYFFDVKITRKNDYFLTITESKKRFYKDGKSYFEKHKIFLYKEDFDKFTECLCDVLKHIQQAGNEVAESMEEEYDSNNEVNFTDVDFGDLERTGTR
jgi:hypothetical protein